MTPETISISSPPVLDELFYYRCTTDEYIAGDRHDLESRAESWGGPGFFACRTCALNSLQADFVPSFPVSDCAKGDELVEYLQRLRINTDRLSRYRGQVRRNQVNVFLNDRIIGRDGNKPKIDTSHYHLAAIPKYQQLTVSGSVPRPVLEEALSIARQAGVAWCWNPFPCHFDELTQLSSGAALLQLSLTEALRVIKSRRSALALTYPSIDRIAKPVLKRLKSLSNAIRVVVTLGPFGACGLDEYNDYYYCQAPQLPKTDFVGLGDCFFTLMSHFIKANEYDLKTSLQLATSRLGTTVSRDAA